jgi:hypothetical protein
MSARKGVRSNLPRCPARWYANMESATKQAKTPERDPLMTTRVSGTTRNKTLPRRRADSMAGMLRAQTMPKPFGFDISPWARSPDMAAGYRPATNADETTSTPISTPFAARWTSLRAMRPSTIMPTDRRIAHDATTSMLRRRSTVQAREMAMTATRGTTPRRVRWCFVMNEVVGSAGWSTARARTARRPKGRVSKGGGHIVRGARKARSSATSDATRDARKSKNDQTRATVVSSQRRLALIAARLSKDGRAPREHEDRQATPFCNEEAGGEPRKTLRCES